MAYNNYYPDYSFIKKLGDKISKRPPKCITVAPWLVGEPLVLAVAQLVQIGTAGKVDHGGWAAHQHLQVHVYNSMILWGQYSKKVTKKTITATALLKVAFALRQYKEVPGIYHFLPRLNL